MLTLFSGSQTLTPSLTKLVYEISGVVDPNEAYIEDRLLKQLRACNYASIIRKGLLNRFGGVKKWKRFSFISNGRVTDFQIKDVIVELNFSEGEWPATGLVIISVRGEVAENQPFIDYIGKILKFVIQGVLKDQCEPIIPAFNVTLTQTKPS